MSNQIQSIRAGIEKVFVGIFCAAIIAFVAGGTFAMCAPGVAAMIA